MNQKVAVIGTGRMGSALAGRDRLFDEQELGISNAVVHQMRFAPADDLPGPNASRTGFTHLKSSSEPEYSTVPSGFPIPTG